MNELSAKAARLAFGELDRFSNDPAERIETVPADIRAAEAFVRDLDTGLRAPDALNIAIAQRIGASLLTFDVKMAASARALGLDVAAA